MGKIRIGPRTATFDVDVAVEFGVTTAIVAQQLSDACNQTSHQMASEGITWYRFDPETLTKIFPYFPLSQIMEEIGRLESLDVIMLWLSVDTDFIWVSWREE